MRVLVTILFVLTALFTNAQSTAGITGIRDTSYNVNNELKKTRRITRLFNCRQLQKPG